MPSTVVTPPEPLVTLDEAKKHVRFSAADDDDYLEGLIDAVIGHLDGPDGVLGRAMGQQTIEERRQGFPGPLAGMHDPNIPAWRLDDEFFIVACPPIISIVSISYPGEDGTRHEVDISALPFDATRISAPAGGWPLARREIGGVRVKYEAGYPTVPAPMKHAVLLMVGTLYANREASIETAFAGAAAALLSNYQRVA